MAQESCQHLERADGVCRACGHCLHEVILNGVCYLCGADDIEVTIKPVDRDHDVVPLSRLKRSDGG